MDEQTQVTERRLPDDWRDNTGSDFMRMTGEGSTADLIFTGCEKSYNERFKKHEYRWTVLQLPGRIPRILCESSKRFCSTLKRYELEHGPLFGQEVRIGFVKERDTRGKEGKLWTIIPLSERIL